MSMTTTYTGVRITDMPDLGAVTDTSSVVGERAGSGRFNALALRDYMANTFVTQAAFDALRLPFNVRAYGAIGDGVADDTAACQACITAAGEGGTVLFPAGTYKMSATLNCLLGQQIYGEGVNNSIITRFTDYGDTMRFAVANSIKISGLWFFHGTMYGTTDTALTNRVTSNSAHVRLQQAQGVVIEDCWMWRMPFQIAIDQGSLVKIHRCNIQGTWDPNYVAAQEGIAAVQVGGVGYTQIVAVEHCYFGGSGNSNGSVTFTSGDTGAHTFSGVMRNCGNQFAVLLIQCEDFVLSNSYLGGNSLYCFGANLASGSVNLDWRFIGNFFDGAGLQQAMMGFLTQADGTLVTAVSIIANVFNGEMLTQNAIQMVNSLGNQPVVTNFSIVGNSFMATVGSAIMLHHARGGTITGNSITGYNARNVTAGADLTFCCAVYFAANATHIIATGNLVGGTINTANTPSYCYRDFYLTGAPGTNAAVNNLILGGGLSGTQNGLMREYVVNVTAAGAYTMTGNEDVIVVNKSGAEATQIVLPASGTVVPGFVVTIKDGKGDANLNPTQVAGSVDGVVNPIYNTAYFTRRLVWNGAQWNVIGN